MAVRDEEDQGVAIAAGSVAAPVQDVGGGLPGLALRVVQGVDILPLEDDQARREVVVGDICARCRADMYPGEVAAIALLGFGSVLGLFQHGVFVQLGGSILC